MLPNQKGFTLIELAVVIVIIAVLAIIGFAVFSGLIGAGNDARRQTDLNAIAKALEVNKGSTYVVLANKQFASGSIPKDPVGGSKHGPYCVSAHTSGTLGNAPTLAQLYIYADPSFTCNPAGVISPTVVGAAGQGWNLVSTTKPPTGTRIWMVCGAIGDPSGAAGTTVICRTSAQ